MKKLGVMKKVLFMLGILFLLFGLMIGNPEGMRDTIDRIDDDTRKGDIHEHFNNTYNQTHDLLGDNTDIGAYGMAMLGILIILVCVTRKNDEGAGLLYQSEKKQQIDPADLEKRLKKNPMISIPDKTDAKKDLFELPDLEMPDQTEIRKRHHKIKQPIASVDLPQASKQDRTDKPDKENDHTSAHSKTNGVNGTPGPAMKTASCPDCDEIVNISGNITEVLCPRCGKKYQPA